MVNISTKGIIITVIFALALLLPTLYAQSILIGDAIHTGDPSLIHSTFRDNISLNMAMVSVIIAFVLLILTIGAQKQTDEAIKITKNACKNTNESLKVTQETLALIKNEINKK